MRNAFYALGILVLSSFLLAGCKKNNKMATVIKNCTGYYLRVDGKEYRVCNYMKLNAYSHGISIEVNFKEIKKCDSDQIACQLAYPYESDIRVTYVR